MTSRDRCAARVRRGLRYELRRACFGARAGQVQGRRAGRYSTAFCVARGGERVMAEARRVRPKWGQRGSFDVVVLQVTKTPIEYEN